MAKWTIPTEMTESPTVALLRAENKRLREVLLELERCITDQGFPFDGHMLTTIRETLKETNP